MWERDRTPQDRRGGSSAWPLGSGVEGLGLWNSVARLRKSSITWLRRVVIGIMWIGSVSEGLCGHCRDVSEERMQRFSFRRWASRGMRSSALLLLRIEVSSSVTPEWQVHFLGAGSGGSGVVVVVVVVVGGASNVAICRAQNEEMSVEMPVLLSLLLVSPNRDSRSPRLARLLPGVGGRVTVVLGGSMNEPLVNSEFASSSSLLRCSWSAGVGACCGVYMWNCGGVVATVISC